MDIRNIVCICLIQLYIALFLLAPIFSTKILALFGFALPAGMLLMTFSYGILDTLNEIYGLQATRRVILSALITRFVIWLAILGIVSLPAVVEPTGFSDILYSSFRILMAGEISIFVSQYFLDSWIFDKIKKLFKRGFWYRYNISNLFGATTNLVLFIFLAFLGTNVPIVNILISALIYRVIISIILTPVFMGIVRFMRDGKSITT